MDSRVIIEDNIGKALDIFISIDSSAYFAMWEELTGKQKNLMVAPAKEELPEVFSKNLKYSYMI